MPALLPRRVVAVWGALVAATLTSWWLGAEQALHSAQAASVAVLAVAFVKVRLVGLHFMDLRAAPRVLRSIFEAWCLAIAALVIALYLLA